MHLWGHWPTSRCCHTNWIWAIWPPLHHGDLERGQTTQTNKRQAQHRIQIDQRKERNTQRERERDLGNIHTRERGRYRSRGLISWRMNILIQNIWNITLTASPRMANSPAQRNLVENEERERKKTHKQEKPYIREHLTSMDIHSPDSRLKTQ